MHHNISFVLFSLVLLTGYLVGPIPRAETARAAEQPMQLAQGDVGMFIDSQGRRVYYDLRTDRIIAVEGPGQPQRSLLDRVFPTAPRQVAPPPQGGFPPPPAPPASSAEAVPAPRGVERRPLDQQGDQSGPLIQRLEDFLQERKMDGQQAIPNPDDRQPAEPEIRSAAIPRTDFNIPKDGKVVAKLQVLLDRRGFSPGVIDGQMGSNVRKALDAYRFSSGEQTSVDDEVAIEEQLAAAGGPAFKDYTITPQDAAGPFISRIPIDYGEKAKLTALSYTSPAEMLAERFHMAEDYLVQLNPDVNFYQPGTVIRVADTGANLKAEVARIEADKSAEQVRAYNSSGKLVAAYPATIGSTDTPSPSGTVQVERIAIDPNYTYNPKINFVQGNNNEILTIPPGPNGPVGSIWIALSKPTYGIHGTPEPDRIGKTNSHGCVRLTNWDAAELAKMVSRGVTVQFVD